MEMPDLGPEDVPDIKTLSREELDKVPFEVMKWECCVEGCAHFTRIRDYGILPVIYWRREWVNLQQHIFFCQRHIPTKAHPERETLSRKLGAGINHIKK